MPREIKLDGGKYTVVRGDDGSLHALRYGESWRDLTGDNLVGSMMAEIEELRSPAFAKHLFNALYNCGDFDGGAGLIERIQKALAVPPDEWDTEDHYGGTALGYWPS